MAFHSLFRATLCIFFLSYFMPVVIGHARLIKPPSRASMWRFGFSYNKPDYNDNEGNCGGFAVQHQTYNGKCGVCGDPWLPRPRQHERGGVYYTGEVTDSFKAGDVINAVVEITANHKGYFEFRICAYDNPAYNDIEQYTNGTLVEVSQSCLDKHILQLANGQGTKYFITSNDGMGFFDVPLKIPDSLHCNKCLFQWHYQTGNSWGVDASGNGCIGCGNQEEFKACADITIAPSGTTQTTQATQATTSTKPKEITTGEQVTESTTVNNETTTNVTTVEPITDNYETTPVTTKNNETTTTVTTVESTTNNYETTPVTTKETTTTGSCRPTLIYSRVPGMTNWCEINCRSGFCPPSHCQCN